MANSAFGVQPALPPVLFAPGDALEGRIRALSCRRATARDLASGERIMAVQSRQVWECPPGSPGAGGRWCRYCPLRTAIFTGRTCQWRCTQFYHKESRAPSSPQTDWLIKLVSFVPISSYLLFFFPPTTSPPPLSSYSLLDPLFHSVPAQSRTAQPLAAPPDEHNRQLCDHCP